MSALASHEEQAMVTFLDHHKLLNGATQFYHADSLAYWKKRQNLPSLPATVDEASIRFLKNKLVPIFTFDACPFLLACPLPPHLLDAGLALDDTMVASIIAPFAFSISIPNFAHSSATKPIKTLSISSRSTDSKIDIMWSHQGLTRPSKTP